MIPAIGTLTEHMAIHLFLMNAVAPLAALAAVRLAALKVDSRPQVFPAMLAQLALLWAWHAPPLLSRTMVSPGLHALMQLSLFAAALWFWSSMLGLRGGDRWRGLLALLLTAKIFCLLGVLLVFAPRGLYPALLSASHAAGHAMPIRLEDQQLAGLLMLVVCPVTYLTAGVAMAARCVFGIDALSVRDPGPDARRSMAANAG